MLRNDDCLRTFYQFGITNVFNRHLHLV
jgi:hypothetical protein